MRENLEYWLVVSVARVLGWLPRQVSRLCAGVLAFAVYHGLSRLRRVGERNLQFAFPEVTSAKERATLLRGVYRHLGWQLVEFCRMSRYTRENTSNWIRTEGLEHYLAAQGRGQGVLIVTGHLGAWELSSFYHSLMGYPMGMVIRRLDNRRLDAYVNAIRCMHGNRVMHKDDFARGLLTAMRKERDGWHSDGYQHAAATRCVRGVLRSNGVHRVRAGESGAQDRCCGSAGIHAVGAR